MNLDDKFILVFVRQNMFPDHQMVHSFHLGLLIGKALDGFCQKRHQLTGHPNVLLFGVPDEDGLGRTAIQLREMHIEFIEWRDPDANQEHDDYGLTGFVTEPLTKTQRNKLPRFKQWSASNNMHPKGPLVPSPEWQPMNTAPRDGSEILLRVKMRAGIPGKYLVGHWMPGGHCIEDHPPIEAGWYFWNGRMFDQASEPTEWKPLEADTSTSGQVSS